MGGRNEGMPPRNSARELGGKKANLAGGNGSVWGGKPPFLPPYLNGYRKAAAEALEIGH